MSSDSSSRIVRFGVFEVDLKAGDLRRSGLRVKLQEQPLQVLAVLLEHPGELVTREELREKLWPTDTFVDFDHGVNAAVKRLREALGDSADSPRFVETLPRRGYRFIVPIEWKSAEPEQPTPDSAAAAASRSGPSRGVQDMPEVQPVTAARLRLRIARSAFALTGVTLVAVALLLLFLLRPRTPIQPDDALTVLPFTTYPGFEAAPSFSPDGNQIAFTWSKEGLNFDLYVKQIGQERALRLTYRPATYLVPAWSPDGRFIAFARRGKNDNDTGIYLMPALGGSERKLADATASGYYPFYLLSWSPDGKWLAFSKEDFPMAQLDSASSEHARIHLLNVESAEQRVLPDPSADCTTSLEPAFSPDGKYLATVCMLTEGVNRIYMQPSEGGRAREVTVVRGSGGFFKGFLEGLAWAVDSQSLLYSSQGYLWRVPMAGGKVEKLLFAQDTQTPAVAHNGNRLAYAKVNFPAGIWRMELASATKPAGPAMKIISSSRGEWNPEVSPDGKRITFESRRSGNLQIWVCDRDGSNPVRVSSFGAPMTGELGWLPDCRRPHWSPDSRRIIFWSNASGHAELYIVNADGGLPRQLSTGTVNASDPYWSADGRWIYFSTQRPDAIWRVAAQGGAAVQFTKEGRYDPMESVDGKRLFYVAGGGIFSMPTDGGDERFETVSDGEDASWAPAQHGIYFLSADESTNRGRLSFFDFTTRRLQKLAELEPGAVFPGDMGISRDGRTIFYSEIDQRFADIMLVEGFR